MLVLNVFNNIANFIMMIINIISKTINDIINFINNLAGLLNNFVNFLPSEIKMIFGSGILILIAIYIYRFVR